MVWERRPYADEAPPPAPASDGVDGFSGEFEDDSEAEISIHPLNNATVIITARNAQSQKNEWKERAVLNADGEYFDEAKEAGSWQDAWAQRAAKASKMSGDDILNAARGAGNVDASQPESAKARKRRAVAACRTDAVRERMAAGTAAECLERALAGETDFVLGKS